MVYYSGMNAIKARWVYKIKLKASGEISKHKTILVEKGFIQNPNIDFNKVHAPFSRLETM